MFSPPQARKKMGYFVVYRGGNDVFSPPQARKFWGILLSIEGEIVCLARRRRENFGGICCI